MMKKIAGVVLAMAILVCFEGTVIRAMEVTPRYVSSSNATVTLSFNDNTAICMLTVSGKSGTSKITGTLKLYDVTAGATAKKWTISKNGSIYSGSKTAVVTSGHKYRLKFTGKVYDAAGVAENVTAKVVKTN